MARSDEPVANDQEDGEGDQQGEPGDGQPTWTVDRVLIALLTTIVCIGVAAVFTPPGTEVKAGFLAVVALAMAPWLLPYVSKLSLGAIQLEVAKAREEGRRAKKARRLAEEAAARAEFYFRCTAGMQAAYGTRKAESPPFGAEGCQTALRQLAEVPVHREVTFGEFRDWAAASITTGDPGWPKEQVDSFVRAACYYLHARKVIELEGQAPIPPEYATVRMAEKEYREIALKAFPRPYESSMRAKDLDRQKWVEAS